MSKTITVELSPKLPLQAVVGILKVVTWPLKKAEEFVLDQTIDAMEDRLLAHAMEANALYALNLEAIEAEIAKDSRSDEEVTQDAKDMLERQTAPCKPKRASTKKTAKA